MLSVWIFLHTDSLVACPEVRSKTPGRGDGLLQGRVIYHRPLTFPGCTVAQDKHQIDIFALCNILHPLPYFMQPRAVLVFTQTNLQFVDLYVSHTK